MRYDLERLRSLAGLTRTEVTRAAGLAGRDYATAWTDGVSWKVADRCAVACGFHPGEVWPEWIAEGVEQAKERRREVARRSARRRYQQDPERRRVLIERSAAYYAENTDYVNWRKRQARRTA